MTSKEPVHAKRGWLRWTGAGLLVCAVYASHFLPVPARSQALSAERRAITSTFHVPHWTVPWPPGGAAAPAHRATSPGAAWTPPVKPARVVQAFGWHHSQFAGNISLQTGPHAQVRAFAPAVVASANQDEVSLKAGDTLIVFKGLTQVAVRGGAYKDMESKIIIQPQITQVGCGGWEQKAIMRRLALGRITRAILRSDPCHLS